MVSRKGFVVYYTTSKIIPEIEKLGVHVVYKNDKRNYLTGYVDSPNYERVKTQIEAMKAVKKFEESLMEVSNYEFSE
jgi:uncharacterized protein YlbG (UPF0298 family)